ncbi:hypothetical protein HK107_08935 [Parvularcula sp. ZS-1/3]|uniref:Blue (type 1) copper domain-containing protein n=1 Tax=Parvularcula mediterranea TaxID=2732508 RepID=A0A7Y3RLS4_9PROT|nr:plastocyanin/azurin family copper-binding protein [Parvularcula mediterranea]NNU16443.1 hypothetical protein [Parvularcula mediterranea]
MKKYALMTGLIVALPAFGWAEDPVKISQEGRRFHPAEVTIAPSMPMHVLNDDRFTHHIFYEAKDETFDSGEQPPGRAVDITFDEEGEYHVQCAIHPKMKLKVTVAEPK